MKRMIIFFVALILCLGCIPDPNLKELDLKAFKITIPKSWVYKKLQGEDSFVGEIVIRKSVLSFDFSNMGYANSLIPTEQDYLNGNEWLTPCLFCKTGITYTASFNVHAEKLRQMNEKGITDSTLVKVEADPEPDRKIHKPNTAEKQKYPKADYVALLTYRDSTILFPIQIPYKIKLHNIRIDTTDKYIIKTIWPKSIGKGITGIYFHGRKNHLTFNLSGYGLSQLEQEQALTAFKSIKIIE